jgi:imidazolonepropionase-like amidohydrolase
VESLQAQSPRPIGITHVTIIDVERGTRLRDQTIVVEGNRIATVGLSSQVRIPDGYGVVEGRGKFVIPGLVDAYVPLVRDPASAAPADSIRRVLASFVPFGVTSIREASARDVDLATMAWRNVRDDAGMPLPRISFAEAEERFSLGLPGGTDARELAQRLLTDRITGVMRVGALRPLGSNHRDDSPPADTSDRAATRLYRTTEWLYEDTALTDSLIRLMVKRRVWLQPALVTEDLMLTSTEQLRQHPGAPFTHRPLEQWRDGYPTLRGAELERARKSVDAMKRFVRRFHDAGGMVIAGTGGVPFNGAGLHDELRLLVEAGLTPTEALRTATLDAARTFRPRDRAGKVVVGNLADLLVLDADPTDDIRNTARIAAVVLDGRFIDGEERQKLFARLAAR